MTGKQKLNFVKDMCSEWQEKFHLGNWQFDITIKEKDEDDSILTINPCPTYSKAAIIVYPLFWKQPPDQQDQAMAHELLHCILEPLVKISFDLLNGKLQTGMSINETTENVVQRLATIISPLKASVYSNGQKEQNRKEPKP